MIPQLSSRALNRALLARQLLLRRERRPVLETLAHLVGMQAQEPLDPYTGLWSRLEGFAPAQLGDALLQRHAVRIALQRSTIHLVTAEDCLALQPALQVVQDRLLMGSFRRPLEGIDLAELASAGRALVEERPRTFADLGRLLAERWPGRDELALAIGVRTQVPLVQPPPRGVWGRRGRALHTSVESWLGRSPGPAIAREDLVLRYLGAFGPASVRDAQAWCGLTRLRDDFERLRPRLATFRDESESELFDLPDAPRPEADTPVSVRFVPQFDNVLLSHAERSRIVPPGIAERIYQQHGHWSPLLIDGYLRGTWKLRRERRTATLAVELAEPVQDPALEEEAQRLLAFLAGNAETRTVRFLP